MVRKFLAFLMSMVLLMSHGISQACSSPAVYRSVVLNSMPDQLLDDAIVFHLRVESAYVVNGEIQGIRGVLVEPAGLLPAGAEIMVAARLGSMCHTWIEMWSSNPSVTDEVLSGFLVGRLVGEENGRTVVWPVLYRGEYYRNGERGNGIWLMADARHRQMPGGQWEPLRVDGEALANNLNETNRLIREALKAEDND